MTTIDERAEIFGKALEILLPLDPEHITVLHDTTGEFVVHFTAARLQANTEKLRKNPEVEVFALVHDGVHFRLREV